MYTIPVAGIDVGKRFSEMCILSPTNQVLGRLRINHDSFSNFEKAFELLRKAEKEFEAKPVVVMESTGHYHKILFQSLTKIGYEVSVINPIQTDSIKNLGIRKVKNDKVDARRIALLYRFQELKATKIPNQDIDCLRNLCRHYYKIADDLAAFKNRLISIIDQIMLNLSDVFDDVCCPTAIAILEKYPTPSDILNADKNELISLIQKSARRSLSWAVSKYQLLYSKALEFEPLSITSRANTAMLKANITMVKTLSKTLDEVSNAINGLIEEESTRDMPILSILTGLLQTIPGIGTITAATIIAEVGDFSVFTKPHKLVAYFGIDPSVVQSGQFEGTQNKMSKRGPKLLRRALYTVALNNIQKPVNGKQLNPVLYELYQKKCLTKPKMVAIGAVMHKLVLIIFAVMRDRKPFILKTPEEHAKTLLLKNVAA